MGSPEMSLAFRVTSRFSEPYALYEKLHTLNLKYPGERKRNIKNRNPEYEAQRSGILERKRELERMQNQEREMHRKGV